eukprot:scaffold27202_cov64-Phaeocystis_antarctica.AAC.1
MEPRRRSQRAVRGPARRTCGSRARRGVPWRLVFNTPGKHLFAPVADRNGDTHGGHNRFKPVARRSSNLRVSKAI